MSARAWFGSVGSLGVALGLGACSSPPPAEPAPQPTATAAAAPATAEAAQEIPKEPVASGKDCVKAESQCGGGVCALTLDNACEQPVTCALAIVTVCEDNHDLVQVKGRSRATFPARNKGELSVPARCTSGNPVSTRVDALECQ